MPTESGLDTYVIELPSYNVFLEDGNYSEEEKKYFLKLLKTDLLSFLNMHELEG